MNVVLKLDEISKSFPLKRGSAVHALKDVSIEVNRSETLALVGESGCGKSTLSNVAMRLMEPDSGRIELGGVDITHLSRRALKPHRRKMQMVFQDPYASLNPRQTVGDSVALPLTVHNVASGEELDQRVAELFEQVGLKSEDRNRYPHQFSGGQRQRICIARAIALNPELMIADEAVSALDVSIQARVINLMLDLQEQLGLAYLFVSHDLAVVERVAHRVAVMYLGQVVEAGPRRAVFEDPRHPYTKRLLSAVPVADPAARHSKRLTTGDIPSPVWAAGTGPEKVHLVEVTPGHFVADEDWSTVPERPSANTSPDSRTLAAVPAAAPPAKSRNS
jgi:ABC-type oligopeptide transport system ATPase subunit